MLPPMTSGQSDADSALSQVAAALGVPDPGALGRLSQQQLRTLTHRQLLEGAKRLGLPGVSKLNKEELSARLLKAFAALGGPSGAREQAGTVGDPTIHVPPPTEDPEHSHLSHKFELGEHAAAPTEEPTSIPWSYGVDRVTASAVDPDRLFVYWEVGDEAIARARGQLGAGGEGAWLNLRVYDTTGRIFDGTNAHSYFDHRVERHDRHWFFHVGKPTSQAVVEVGLRSHEGFFVKIARSGRVEFPRKEPAPWADPEWLTVRSGDGAVEHAGRGAPGAGAAPGSGGAGPAAGGGVGDAGGAALWHALHMPWDEAVRLGLVEGGERIEWEQVITSGTFEGFEQFTWEGPVTISSWEAGPFSYPVEAPVPEREERSAPTRVYRVGGRTHVVQGPWQVVIRGLGAHGGRAVLARWEVHRSWIAEEGVEVRGQTVRIAGRAPGSSELLTQGASERRWRAASELRLGGSSELYFVGASELRLRGASERLYQAASELRLRGASERLYQAASELRFAGASEQLLRGASERAWKGASEQLLRGASERRFAGASEERLGGASEERARPRENHFPPPPGERR